MDSGDVDSDVECSINDRSSYEPVPERFERANKDGPHFKCSCCGRLNKFNFFLKHFQNPTKILLKF